MNVKIKDGLPRSLEVVAALIGLLLAAPLMALLAVLVAASSRGPVFFRQRRVGRRGRPFVLYKFRTMRTGNHGPQVTARNDDRVTRVGRLLRKTKLDELPELWNVLIGDLSLVGPRPEVPRYVNLENPLWQCALQARPGLTDPVTLRLRNEEELLSEVTGDREHFYLKTLQPYKLKGYLAYLQERSWRSDVAVLWKTLIAVLFPSKAPPPTAKEILT
jgi:lipopolysaccharide/colanic/teichoic acid biosynthesis glycosyltransferase